MPAILSPLAGRFDHFHGDEDLLPELDARSRDIAEQEAELWLRRNPEVLAERIQAESDNQTLFELLRIFTDCEGDIVGRGRDVVDKQITKFAKLEARNG